MYISDKIEVGQLLYVYKVRYKYAVEEEYEIGYICTNSDIPLSDWVIEDRFDLMEEGDEWETLEVFESVFNFDDFLCDELVAVLMGSYQGFTIDEINDYIGYIDYIINYEIGYNERSEYKKHILKSVLKKLDLRKRNSLMDYTLNRLLNNILGLIEIDIKTNFRRQIELILEPKANDEILSKLVKVDYVKAMRKHLDRLGEEYQLSEEKSKYRIGVIFLRFFYECTVWQPSFYNEDKTIRKYSEYMRLMAKYFGLDDEIKYREDKLKQYKPHGVARPLYSTIKTEHYNVWMTLP